MPPRPTDIADTLASSSSLPHQALLDAMPVFAALTQTDGAIVGCNQLLLRHVCGETSDVRHQLLSSLLTRELARLLLEPPGRDNIRQPVEQGSNNVSWISWSSKRLPGHDDLVLVTGIDISREVELERYITHNQWFETAAALSGGLAHDFNNALAGVLGLSEIISLRLPDDSPLQDFTTRIATSVDRAKLLVRRFSQFSRKSHGALDAQPTAMMLDELMLLLKAFMPSNVQVSSDISAESPWCHAERHALEQIILNCSTYFRSRLRDEGGTLRLTSRAGEDCETTLIELTASGPGLAGLDLDQAFSLDLKPSATAYESGAALYTANKLAVDGGCQLSLRSEEAHTFTFSIAVPLAN